MGDTQHDRECNFELDPYVPHGPVVFGLLTLLVIAVVCVAKRQRKRYLLMQAIVLCILVRASPSLESL